jgi:superfamily II DNA or RNA helicase
LEVFEEEFKARGFGDIGYYIGGMKASARDESATKQIILASYTMAAEGMNIPALNTVALVTPKSRIEQAVGRIFRQKKEERTFHPVIFDIIDEPFDILMSQYKKREAFYKQCGYKIMTKRPGDAAYTEKKRYAKAAKEEASALPSGVPMFKS